MNWRKENNQTFQECLDTVFDLKLIPENPKQQCDSPDRAAVYRGQGVTGVLAQGYFALEPLGH